MRHDMDGPAGTAITGIVHDALRRDLRRTPSALVTTRAPDGAAPASGELPDRIDADHWIHPAVDVLVEEGTWPPDDLHRAGASRPAVRS